MKIGKLVRNAAISLATLAMCLPQVVFAAAPAPTPAVVDIALADGGVLHGQVVDLQGSGTAGVPVSVRTQDREVTSATTTDQGRFSVQGLRGGVYQVATGQGQGVYRLWSAGTAPPSAQKDAIVYTQHGYGSRGALKMWLSNPLVVAGIVAVAVAVPVALANSGGSSSP